MTSSVSQISRKAIKEDSDALTAQQIQFPCYHPDGLEEEFGRPSVFEEVSEHFSRHQPQGTHVCIDIRTTQRTSTLKSTCSHRCPNSKLKAANSEDRMQPSER
jgi:hypothetical protein